MFDGKTVAVVIPKGFGDAAGIALFAGRDKPEFRLFYDPSRAPELGMVRGIFTEHVMQAVSREVFSAAAGRRSRFSTTSANSRPSTPPMNRTGMKTAASDRVIDTMVNPISLEPFKAAAMALSSVSVIVNAQRLGRMRL